MTPLRAALEFLTSLLLSPSLCMQFVDIPARQPFSLTINVSPWKIQADTPLTITSHPVDLSLPLPETMKRAGGRI